MIDPAPRVVVLRALGLGDALTGIPALRALVGAFPHHRLTLAAPRRFARMLISAGAAHDVTNHTDLSPLSPHLREPDVAVDLHGRGPGSQPLLTALRPRRLICFAHPAVAESAGHPRWRPAEHEVRRWCRLLEESGIPADPGRLAIRAPDGQAPEAAVGATVIHAGAASASRRWPAARFAAVARAERAEGRNVVITGSASEVLLARQVAAAAGLAPDHVLAGRTDLDGLTRVVAAAARVVCGDTGIAHLATALGTPSVVVFGPVPPREWGPPPSPRHVALWSGRRGDPHGSTVDPGLLEITVGQVIEALSRLPGESRGVSREVA
ncbi:MAG TPA: glycosyltransferase family 9 protein [Acidimicrobiales bacterium]|nr:glycosyltransferase family 9 protein [Acidimicrobiales bacterium]